MYAVLYFKRPFSTGITFPVSTIEALCVKNLFGARMMRGRASEGTEITWYEIRNISIISDEDLPSFHPEMYERFDSFETFVKTTRGGIKLTNES